MISVDDINLLMVKHLNGANQSIAKYVDENLKLSAETITNRKVSGHGFANTKTYYFIDNDSREFLSLDDLINAYNEKYQFEDENPDFEVTYIKVIKPRVKIKTNE
jgi:hypothetical protein